MAWELWELRAPQPGFSPLREGDTSVARNEQFYGFYSNGFSPLREGDTSVAYGHERGQPDDRGVSVPFARGTPPWRWRGSCSRRRIIRFSPLREGDTSVAPSAAA